MSKYRSFYISSFLTPTRRNSLTKSKDEDGMRMDKIARGVQYRMDEQFQNLLIFKILIVFQFEQILKTC